LRRRVYFTIQHNHDDGKVLEAVTQVIGVIQETVFISPQNITSICVIGVTYTNTHGNDIIGEAEVFHIDEVRTLKDRIERIKGVTHADLKPEKLKLFTQSTKATGLATSAIVFMGIVLSRFESTNADEIIRTVLIALGSSAVAFWVEMAIIYRERSG